MLIHIYRSEQTRVFYFESPRTGTIKIWPDRPGAERFIKMNWPQAEIYIHPSAHTAREKYASAYKAAREKQSFGFGPKWSPLYTDEERAAYDSHRAARYRDYTGWIDSDRQERFENWRETSVPELAQELYDSLRVMTLDDGTYRIVTTDNAEDWVSEIVHTVHSNIGQGFLPSDTVYDIIHTCAEALTDLESLATRDEMQERLDQIEPDIYNSDLFAWLAVNLSHQYYVDEAVQEFGDTGELSRNIAMGQMMQIREIGSALIDALEEEADSRS